MSEQKLEFNSEVIDWDKVNPGDRVFLECTFVVREGNKVARDALLISNSNPKYQISDLENKKGYVVKAPKKLAVGCKIRTNNDVIFTVKYISNDNSFCVVRMKENYYDIMIFMSEVGEVVENAPDAQG